MEEARLARKESYEREASASANGPGKNLPRGKSKRGEKSPPPDPTAAAFRAVDGVTDDVDALEREVNDAARAASESGLEEKTHAGLNNRLRRRCSRWTAWTLWATTRFAPCERASWGASTGSAKPWTWRTVGTGARDAIR